MMIWAHSLGPIMSHFFKSQQHETTQFNNSSSFSLYFNYTCNLNRFPIIKYFNKYKNIKEKLNSILNVMKALKEF